jgi:hypothetical protein
MLREGEPPHILAQSSFVQLEEEHSKNSGGKKDVVINS